tara:strand:- start:1163 stop:1480 length:318 start_codon:yes stop_codon:yes gene_type:complete
MINILSLIKALEQNNNHVEKSQVLALDFKPILLTQKPKPKPKEADMNEQVKTLQNRIGNLTDRVQLLENELRDTQEKVQKDISKLLNIIQNKAGTARSTSTYRGP